MQATSIFWPVLTQIALTLCMFIVLGMRKAKAVKAGEVNRKEAALNNQAWPNEVIQVSNNIANQFETPVLFYTLCGLLYASNGVGYLAIALAWAYALSRVFHAFVHIGSNYVPTRMRLFMLGCLILIAMTILTAVNLLS